jgi:hypothetical protein
MFMHKQSQECRYGRRCNSKLCQFQHTNKDSKETNDEGKECTICEYIATNSDDLSKHQKINHKYQKFDEMDEDEKYEVNEYICANLCWQGDQKCYEKEEENELLGIDVGKIKEDYRNCVEEESFKCEICDYMGFAIINVKEHFLKTHRKNYQLSCWKCEEKCKTIFELRKHVGTFHYTPQTEN